MVNTQPQCTERLPCILLQNNLPVSLTGRSSYSPNRTHEPEQFAVAFVSSPPSSQNLCVQFWPLTDARESTPIESDSSVCILHIFAQIMDIICSNSRSYAVVPRGTLLGGARNYYWAVRGIYAVTSGKMRRWRRKFWLKLLT